MFYRQVFLLLVFYIGAPQLTPTAARAFYMLNPAFFGSVRRTHFGLFHSIMQSNLT